MSKPDGLTIPQSRKVVEALYDKNIERISRKMRYFSMSKDISIRTIDSIFQLNNAIDIDAPELLVPDDWVEPPQEQYTNQPSLEDIISKLKNFLEDPQSDTWSTPSTAAPIDDAPVDDIPGNDVIEKNKKRKR